MSPISDELLNLLGKWSADMAVAIVLGDHNTVMESARGYSSERAWRRSQNFQASVGTGGLTSWAIVSPAAALPAALGGALWVLRRTAHVTWGIGAIRGAQVDPLEDLFCTWALWAGVRKDEIERTMRAAKVIVQRSWRPLVTFSPSPLMIGAAKTAANAIWNSFSIDSKRRMQLVAMQQAILKWQAVIVPVAGGITAAGLTSLTMMSISKCAGKHYDSKRAFA